MNRRLARVAFLAGDVLIIGYGFACFLTDRLLAAQSAAVRTGIALEKAHDRAQRSKDYR